MLLRRRTVAIVGMAVLASLREVCAAMNGRSFRVIDLYYAMVLFVLVLSFQQGTYAAPRQAVSAKESTSSPKQQLVKAPSKSYKKVASPSGKHATRSQLGTGNLLQVYVCKTRSGDMVMLLRRPNGSAPFVYLTTNYLRRNPDFARNTLNIHHIMDQVDPHEPTAYLSQISQGNSDRRHTLFVHVFPAGAEDSNNAQNRRAWADVFIRFFNHPNNQKMYKYTTTAHFAGDTTPQNEDEAPHLSTYLTIRDTMTVMRDALAETEDRTVQEIHNNDGMAMIETCLANEAAMNDYYHPDHVLLARRFFSAFTQHHGPEEDDNASEEFADIRPFQYN